VFIRVNPCRKTTSHYPRSHRRQAVRRTSRKKSQPKTNIAAGKPVGCVPRTVWIRSVAGQDVRRGLPALSGLVMFDPATAGYGSGRMGQCRPTLWHGQDARATSGVVLARRRPRFWLRLPGVFLLRFADRQFLALLFQLPPRLTRLPPEGGPSLCSAGHWAYLTNRSCCAPALSSPGRTESPPLPARSRRTDLPRSGPPPVPSPGGRSGV